MNHHLNKSKSVRNITHMVNNCVRDESETNRTHFIVGSKMESNFKSF